MMMQAGTSKKLVHTVMMKKRAKKNGGFKAIYVTYACIPMVLLLIAAAVFLLNSDGAQGASSTTAESLKVFSTWLQMASTLRANVAAAAAAAAAASSNSTTALHPIARSTLPISTPTTAATTTLGTVPTSASTSISTSASAVPNPPQASKYAYVTLISGFDTSFKYRGFLYNALIMKKSLADAGSLADFIALIGFSDAADTAPYESDMDLLRSRGIITYILPRLVHNSHKLSFAEMALLKITPWSFTQYKKIQFFDGDVMPMRNMDCFFLLPSNTFTVGAVSPLNSGWYLAIPEQKAYEYMLEKAKWRLTRDWDKKQGWAEPVPTGMTVRGGSPLKPLEWSFNGADMDQGLLMHYYVLNNGNVMLVDTQSRTATRLDKGLLHSTGEKVATKKALDCCGGGVPTQFFAHFTGRQKPWMVEKIGSLDPTPKNSDLIVWCNLLDSLQLPINSKTIASLQLGSPLGFWNHNFPKGGFAGQGAKANNTSSSSAGKKNLRGGA